MPVRVIIPTPLRQYAGKKDAVEIEAKTVAEALSGLTSKYGRNRGFDPDFGRVKPVVVLAAIQHQL